MKVNVTKYLNVRVGKPSVNAPCYQYLAPGSELEVDGKLYNGDIYDGIDTWLKDEAENYYWSGGTDYPKESKLFPWWIENSYYSLPKLWLLPKENEITVAILDTGISQHIDFDFTKINGYNYLDNSKEYLNDTHGHGTHLAGIIASQGKKSFGIAPDTNLFIAKVCNAKGVPNIHAVKKALDDIYFGRNNTHKVKIINMSFNLPAQSEEEFSTLQEIEKTLNSLYTEKQCLIVCSSGSKDDLFESFPARLNLSIAVGCLNKELRRSSFSRKTNILDIMAPGESISSSNNSEGVIQLTGTSQSAAFVSAVCALALQRVKFKTLYPELLKRILYQSAYSDVFLFEEYGQGIINPNKFIETLTNTTP